MRRRKTDVGSHHQKVLLDHVTSVITYILVGLQVGACCSYRVSEIPWAAKVCLAIVNHLPGLAVGKHTLYPFTFVVTLLHRDVVICTDDTDTADDINDFQAIKILRKRRKLWHDVVCSWLCHLSLPKPRAPSPSVGDLVLCIHIFPSRSSLFTKILISCKYY